MFSDYTLNTVFLIPKISQKVTKKEKKSLILAEKVKNEKNRTEIENYYLLW